MKNRQLHIRDIKEYPDGTIEFDLRENKQLIKEQEEYDKNFELTDEYWLETHQLDKENEQNEQNLSIC